MQSYVRLYFKNVIKEMQSEIEDADQLWTSYAAPYVCLFQNKVMFLLKIMLIYDDPLLSGQPPISGHLPVPQGLGLMEVQLHTGI